MKSKFGSTALALALGVYGCFVLGCEPEEASLDITGIETSIAADGRVHFSVLVTNGGTESFDGQLCVELTWSRGATLEFGGTPETANGGTVIEDQTPCVNVTVPIDGSTRIEADSSSVGPDILVRGRVVALRASDAADAGGTGDASSTTTPFASPYSPNRYVTNP